ncbi:helix-turn-helix transcriptional regulator [Streptomyces radicis]|uniref:XRE family transcriptional regulator n=1 Tax=Streptomyces radicis TaxID=1750517 RepID=A0A3A9VSI8_9ACTN|nr:helix-turn-helix transcriptional regulator [Streptomyces radicis]RKN03710.1 XRE family transcriptional regulator [Streptomyces radicis]RKN13643.1 XRE family transcriptional regulator [Streptomyces radicis]
MDRRSELSAFLRSRRARLTPADVGLRSYGGRRRVPGLRREEAAWLAGIGLDYYVRLEQGRNEKASAAVLDAVARALRMNPVERLHLHRLARPAREPSRDYAECAVPGLQRLLDAMPATPAYVAGRRTELLAWNHPARVVFGGILSLTPTGRHMARQVFLDPAARALFVDWEVKARAVTARLRLSFGRCPDDGRLKDLVDELLDRSADFRAIWAAQHLTSKTHGSYRLDHPRIGRFTLPYRALWLPEEPDQLLIAYTVEPESPLAAALAAAGAGSG